MSKLTKLVIKTDSKNGAANIKASRDATNLQNLEQDRKAWTKLLEINETDIVDGKVKSCTGYSRKGVAKYKVNAEVNQVYQKMKQQIIRMNSIHFGVSSESEVELWMVKAKVRAILAADDILIQCDYCRNSTRQSIDELVQIATLEKYVNNAVISKPTNGSLTLKDSEIVRKPKTKKANKDPRSIDIVVEQNNVVYHVFAKYAGPVGSVTSKLQTAEAISFLDEAKLYVDKNEDKTSCFIVLVDGHAGEMHLSDMREAVKDYPRIYAGNCEQVIEWLNAI